MLFSGITFIYFFLPLLFLLYYIINNGTWRKGVLIVFSLIFYAWGEPEYVLLMLLSTVINWLGGRLISYRQKKGKSGKCTLGIFVGVDLLMLAVFKYAASVFSYLSFIPGAELPALKLALPLGISFYTFQALSYIIDVYRKEVDSQKYSNVLLYICLFPQLVAGPIVRYTDIVKSVDKLSPNLYDVFDGGVRFCLGLGKKIVLANACGEAADGLFSLTGNDSSTLGSWVGILFYALQIYFDFAGYSDMAIGLGRMLGFTFNENFRYPYVSKSATEFWRRWHISLGSFFRDYLYIPLGGNRSHWLRNTVIVWALTGLWHGGSLNFVLWGLMYGVLIIIEKKFLLKAFNSLGKGLSSVVSYVYMFIVTLVGWTVFRFTDIGEMTEILKSMFFISGNVTDIFAESIIKENLVLLAVALICAFPVAPAVRRFFGKRMSESAFNNATVIVKTVYGAFLLILSTVMLMGSSYNPFLYFRF